MADPVIPPATTVRATTPDQVLVRLRLIGPMAAWTVRGENVLPPGRKTRAILASVAMAAPRPVLRSWLTEQLWSRSSPEQARGSLRQEIHRLLAVLSPAQADILIITRDHLSLRPGAVWSDVDEIRRATAAKPATLSLLDADLLEDLDGTDPSFDIWLQAEREQLRTRAGRITEEILQDTLDPLAMIEAARRLLAIDRSHEGAWQALMRAHHARGERGLALQAYNRCCAALADLLDAVPSAETQTLFGQIQFGSDSLPPLRLPYSRDSAVWPVVPPLDERVTARRGAHVSVASIRSIGRPDEDTHAAAGLTDEIIHALSQFRGMVSVSAGLRDTDADDLDYRLDGSLQQAGDKLRVGLQLSDRRAKDQVIWSRRYDFDARDGLPRQDEIAAKAAAQIAPEILLVEAKRSRAGTVSDATAYECVLRAISLIGRMDQLSFLQAGQYLADAITLDPDYATACAWQAYWHLFLVGQGWTNQPMAMMANAARLAERATALDPADARGWSISGHVRAFLHRQPREAMVLHEQALRLNPNLAMAWALSAVTCAYAGDPIEAQRRIKHYKVLSPLEPHSFFFDAFFALIHLMQRDYEGAVRAGRIACQLSPSFSAGYKPYLAALGHLRWEQEATTVRSRLLALEPAFTIEQFLQANPITQERDVLHYAAGLRLAGIPERG